MERARLNFTLIAPAQKLANREIEKKVSNCADFCDSNYKDDLAKMVVSFLLYRKCPRKKHSQPRRRCKFRFLVDR
jgi:hypothetical protein